MAVGDPSSEETHAVSDLLKIGVLRALFEISRGRRRGGEGEELESCKAKQVGGREGASRKDREG